MKIFESNTILELITNPEFIFHHHHLTDVMGGIGLCVLLRTYLHHTFLKIIAIVAIIANLVISVFIANIANFGSSRLYLSLHLSGLMIKLTHLTFNPICEIILMTPVTQSRLGRWPYWLRTVEECPRHLPVGPSFLEGSTHLTQLSGSPTDWAAFLALPDQLNPAWLALPSFASMTFYSVYNPPSY